jgi:hypothetical protein
MFGRWMMLYALSEKYKRSYMHHGLPMQPIF